MENEVSKRLKEECDFLDEILKEETLNWELEEIPISNSADSEYMQELQEDISILCDSRSGINRRIKARRKELFSVASKQVSRIINENADLFGIPLDILDKITSKIRRF